MKIRFSVSFLMFLLLMVLPVCGVAGKSDKAVSVNCSRGDTIARALQQNENDLLTIKIYGVCHENVEIVRDDVTLLAGSAGATIIGTDSNTNTIDIRAGRTLIDGLIVSGGRSGVVFKGNGNGTIKNSTVYNTGHSGVIFYQGGSGLVDNCIIQNNAKFGMRIDGGSGIITNSSISKNDGPGIAVVRGGNARIGISDLGAYAGNTIADNKSSGILINLANVTLGGNTIQRNGTDLGAVLGQYGILIFNGGASLVGNNVIEDNAGTGIMAQGSRLDIGDTSWGLPISNTIRGNGTSATNKGGIQGFLGSTISMRSATISGNTGNGFILHTRSSARIYGENNVVTNNTGCGIILTLGGAIILDNAPVTVQGNSQWGLFCTDAESSFTGNASGISGNTSGQVSCTGF